MFFIALLSLIATIRIIDATQQNSNDSTTQTRPVILRKEYEPQDIYQPSEYELKISPYVPWNTEYKKFTPLEIEFLWIIESVIWKATNINRTPNFSARIGVQIESLTQDIYIIEWLVKNNFTQIGTLVNGKGVIELNNFIKQSNVVIHVLSKINVRGFDQMYWCAKMISILIDLSSSQQHARQLHFAVAAMVDAYICKWYQVILKQTQKMRSRMRFTTPLDQKASHDLIEWYYDYIFQAYIVKYQITDEELLARLYHLFLSPFNSNIKHRASEEQIQQYHARILIILQELTQYCLENGLVVTNKHANVNVHGQVIRNEIEKQLDWLLAEICAYLDNRMIIGLLWIPFGFPGLESNRTMFWHSLL